MTLTEAEGFIELFEKEMWVLITLEDKSQILCYSTLDIEKLPNGIKANQLYDLRKSRYIRIPEKLYDVRITESKPNISEVLAFVDKFI